jgi:hypothetical protein
MAKKHERIGFWFPIGVGTLVCGAALMWPDIGAELFALGAAIIIASIIHRWVELVPTLICGAIGGILVYGGLFLSGNPLRPGPHIPTSFSWTWDALKERDIDGLYSHVEKVEKQDVQVLCPSDECSALAGSFTQLFSKLGWRIVSEPGLERMYWEGRTGIFLNRSGGQSDVVKNAIETQMGIRVQLVSPGNNSSALSGRAGVDHLLIIVGAKPPPDPIPSEMQRDMLDLSATLKQLSSDIRSFVSDRDREFS